MKKLGIIAYPFSPREVFYSEKFLLSSDEANDLTKKLRKTAMDIKFEGENIPKEILPENLSGQLIEKPNFSPTSVEHPGVNRWKINYVFHPEQDGGNNRKLILYPFLELDLDSSEEGNVLSLTPYLSFFLQLSDRENVNDFVERGAKGELMELVSSYSKGRYFSGNGNRPMLVPSRGLYEGWNFVPFSSAEYICSIIDHATNHIGVRDLGNLDALGHPREHMRKYCYSEEDRYANEFVDSAMRGEHYKKQQELINRIKSAEKSNS